LATDAATDAVPAGTAGDRDLTAGAVAADWWLLSDTVADASARAQVAGVRAARTARAVAAGYLGRGRCGRADAVDRPRCGPRRQRACVHRHVREVDRDVDRDDRGPDDHAADHGPDDHAADHGACRMLLLPLLLLLLLMLLYWSIWVGA
jgi:hypothetical protein